MTVIKLEYRHAFAFLKRQMRTVWLMLAIFFVVAVAAHFIFEAVYREDPAKMQQQINQLVDMMNEKDLVGESGQISAIGLFCNNFIASATAAVLGFVPLLFLPLAALALNASLIGMISAIMSSTQSGGLYELMVSVAPHGIFEIPALLISTAIGVSLCADISARLFRKKRSMPFWALFGEFARLAVLVVVPLLVVAAVLEAYLTPVLMTALL